MLQIAIIIIYACMYRVAQKTSHYRNVNVNKSYKIVLKSANEIRFFFVNLRCQTSTIILPLVIKYSMHDLIFDNYCAWAMFVI